VDGNSLPSILDVFSTRVGANREWEMRTYRKNQYSPNMSPGEELELQGKPESEGAPSRPEPPRLESWAFVGMGTGMVAEVVLGP
jgi:hypothetical protein